jgi:hypothetical protein
MSEMGMRITLSWNSIAEELKRVKKIFRAVTI